MKDSSPIAAIWGVNGFVRNRTAAGRRRPVASDNGGAGRKTKTTSEAATNASGSDGGEATIPTTGAASRLSPKVRYKIPPLRYKIPLTCSRIPPKCWRSFVFRSLR